MCLVVEKKLLLEIDYFLENRNLFVEKKSRPLLGEHIKPPEKCASGKIELIYSKIVLVAAYNSIFLIKKR